MTTKPIESITRICRDCGVVTPAENLVKEKKSKYGYQAICKECKSQNWRQYQLANKPKLAYIQLNNRYAHLPQKVEATEHQIERLFEVFENRCAYCRVEGTDGTNPLGLDHVVPSSKCGGHRLSNLVIACRSCNSRKSNLPLLEFYDRADNFEYTSLISVIAHLSRFHQDDYMRILGDFKQQQIDYNSTE